MKELDVLAVHKLRPLEYFGIAHPFFHINTETIIHTWIILAVLFALLLPIRWFLHNRSTIIYHLLIMYVRTFYDMVKQTLEFNFTYGHFIFVTVLFTFIATCNAVGAIPWLEEPTKDLNTTLSLGLISFVYTQYYAIKAQGLWGYIKEYFAPFFIMLPLNLIGKLATVISISFRLFGNIFGGTMITGIWLSAIKGSLLFETLAAITGLNLIIILFFGLFEAFLQAFVFAMLALTYLSIGIQGEVPEEV